MRDLWPAFAIAVGVLRSRLLIGASLWLEKFLYRHADRVMVNSPGFVEHVKQRGARLVTLVPNGADPDMFTPDGDGLALREQYYLCDQFVTLYAGAHGLSNDLNVVLDCAKILKNEPRIKIVLVGDGKEKKNLQTRSADLQLDNLLLLPAVPKTAMAQTLAAADACIAILKPLELYKTTYPNKVFDYMAAGRPVLLLIDGVIREVVEKADAGVFVPPGDAAGLAKAILALSSDPARAKVMGQNGRIYIEKYFNRAQIAQKFTQLVEEMRRENG